MEIAEEKKSNIGKNCRAFFKKYYALFFAPILVGFFYVLALALYGVYPFGDKYTAASYDLSAQICPFIEHLFDVFDGKSTLTFSYAVVGGADVTGTFLYFFVSPFSFLFLIFGDGKVAHASSVVMLCKLMTISVAGTWFAKKLFKGIPDYLCIAVGVVYTYCGYTFVSNTYINWMDFLIYLPFAAAAFVHFVKTGKFLAFSILVACCIYTCFSIACFSLFTVYPALVAYGLLCKEKGEKHKFIAYLSLSFVCAILMALPILLPALGAYSVSGRGGSLFENLWNGFAVDASAGTLGDFDSTFLSNSYVTSLYRKWSYIVSDSIFVVLTVIWFFRKGLKDKFARFMLVAGVLTLLPTVVDESMNLLNMGSYMSYALRFGFLNALYFMGGACLCIEGWCYKPFSTYDGESLLAPEVGEEQEHERSSKNGGRYALKSVFRKKNKKALLWAGGFILLALIAFIFLLWFNFGTNYRKVAKLFGSDGKSFSGSFAHSLGGLDVVVALFMAVGAVTLVGAYLVGAKKISPRLLSILLVSVVALQTFFYNTHLVVGNRSTQHQILGSYQTINEELNRRDDSYFRVKDFNDKMTACAPFTGGSNSFSVFSSVIDKDNFTTYQLFGYLGNGKNSFKSAHNTGKGNRAESFGDSFLGYKYVVSKDRSLHEDEGRNKYLRAVYALDENGQELLDENGEKVQLSCGELFVYENIAVFPSAYKVTGEGYRFVSPNESNSSYRLNNQKALYKYLSGREVEGSYITHDEVLALSEQLHQQAAEVKVSAGEITAKVTATEGESLLLNFVAVKGYTVTVNGEKAELVDNDLKLLMVKLQEGGNEVVFTYSSPYVKHALAGLIAGILGLCAVAVVLKKTTWMEKLSPIISWAGIGISVAVVGFFMIFPTGVFVAKIVEFLKVLLL